MNTFSIISAIHNIVSINAGRIKSIDSTEDITKCHYYRHLIIKDADGHEFALDLFTDKQGGIDFKVI